MEKGNNATCGVFWFSQRYTSPNFADRNQAIHFMKNLAIAGGFLMLAAGGPGAWSVDGRRET